MKTKDLIAKRERREKARARREKNTMQNAQCAMRNDAKDEQKDEYTLPTRFSEEVTAEVNAIPNQPITPEEVLRRRDMREALTFTIDPDDAKDFDDALSLEVLDNGNYRVGVHIADVTHLVKEGTALDDEAYSRGTSVYLVGKVIPMLPERLSNELCSLRPNEDKLCMSVVMEIDKEAQVVKQKICRTLIRSDYRLTYQQAQEMIDGTLVVSSSLTEALQTLNGLAKILRAERFRHGAINFESPEVYFHLDDEGHPTGVYFRRAMDANRLIEEFMLLANRIVATEMGRAKKKDETRVKPKPFVFRVHDVPDTEKLGRLSRFIQHFGVHLRLNAKRSATNKSINHLFDTCKGRDCQTLIETLAIRAMAKAVYSTDNIGHYGLAFQYYTHFTSPIRRYPDMMVHRLVAHYLMHSKDECRVEKEVLEEACMHCSATEQAAQMAERDSIKEKQAEWMAAHVGEEFDGIVSGVTEFGLFVQLTDTLSEGLVPIRTIEPGDYMQFDEENYCLVAARSGKTYTLSDKVRVRVTKVDVEKHQINFVLVNAQDGDDTMGNTHKRNI